MAYREQKKNILLVRTKRINIIQKVKKKQRPTGPKKANSRALDP